MPALCSLSWSSCRWAGCVISKTGNTWDQCPQDLLLTSLKTLLQISPISTQHVLLVFNEMPTTKACQQKTHTRLTVWAPHFKCRVPLLANVVYMSECVDTNTVFTAEPHAPSFWQLRLSRRGWWSCLMSLLAQRSHMTHEAVRQWTSPWQPVALDFFNTSDRLQQFSSAPKVPAVVSY